MIEELRDLELGELLGAAVEDGDAERRVGPPGPGALLELAVAAEAGGELEGAALEGGEAGRGGGHVGGEPVEVGPAVRPDGEGAGRGRGEEMALEGADGVAVEGGRAVLDQLLDALAEGGASELPAAELRELGGGGVLGQLPGQGLEARVEVVLDEPRPSTGLRASSAAARRGSMGPCYRGSAAEGRAAVGPDLRTSSPRRRSRG
jgi:hypothetical protein